MATGDYWPWGPYGPYWNPPVPPPAYYPFQTDPRIEEILKRLEKLERMVLEKP